MLLCSHSVFPVMIPPPLFSIHMMITGMCIIKRQAKTKKYVLEIPIWNLVATFILFDLGHIDVIIILQYLQGIGQNNLRNKSEQTMLTVPKYMFSMITLPWW